MKKKHDGRTVTRSFYISNSKMEEKNKPLIKITNINGTSFCTGGFVVVRHYFILFLLTNTNALERKGGRKEREG